MTVPHRHDILAAAVAAADLRGPRRRPGFSLVELLFAMAILAIGLISIGALIPVGGKLQRQNFNDLMSAQLASNADAIIRSRGVSRTEVNSVASGQNVVALTRYNNATIEVTPVDYPRADRTLATFDPQVVTSTTPTQRSPDISARLFEFVFAARTDATTGPEVFAFVCRRVNNGGNLIPRSASASRGALKWFSVTMTLPAGAVLSDYFPAGTQIVDNNGRLYTVENVNDQLGRVFVDNDINTSPAVTAIWYVENAAAGGQPARPAKVFKILKFGEEVLR